MQVFFYICEFLGVTPSEFFDENSRYPMEYQEIIDDLNCVSPENLKNLKGIIKGLKK